MTEQEYILVSDLANLRAAIEILRNICPANNECVDRTAYANIVSELELMAGRVSRRVSLKDQTQ